MLILFAFHLLDLFQKCTFCNVDDTVMPQQIPNKFVLRLCVCVLVCLLDADIKRSVSSSTRSFLSSDSM